MFQPWVQEGAAQAGTRQILSTPCFQVFSASPRTPRQVEVAVSMTAAKRVSRGCCGRRPAVTSLRIIAWIPGWPCTECGLRQTVLREPGKSRSRDRCPTSPWISAARCSYNLVLLTTTNHVLLLTATYLLLTTANALPLTTTYYYLLLVTATYYYLLITIITTYYLLFTTCN